MVVVIVEEFEDPKRQACSPLCYYFEVDGTCNGSFAFKSDSPNNHQRSLHLFPCRTQTEGIWKSHVKQSWLLCCQIVDIILSVFFSSLRAPLQKKIPQIPTWVWNCGCWTCKIFILGSSTLILWQYSLRVGDLLLNMIK